MHVIFKGKKLVVEFTEYQYGGTAIRLNTTVGEPYMTASVNLLPSKVQDHQIAIKNYSENEGILEALIEANIISKPVSLIVQGFVNIPVCNILTQKHSKR